MFVKYSRENAAKNLVLYLWKKSIVTFHRCFCIALSPNQPEVFLCSGLNVFRIFHFPFASLYPFLFPSTHSPSTHLKTQKTYLPWKKVTKKQRNKQTIKLGWRKDRKLFNERGKIPGTTRILVSVLTYWLNILISVCNGILMFEGTFILF